MANYSLDLIRDGDREKILELQRKADCEFPLPDPLTGFVVRDGDTLVGWAGWEQVAEIMGIIDPDLGVKDKMRIWSSLHKPVESEVLRKGILVAYAHIRNESHRFAAILKLFGWNLCPGFWMRREAGKGLNQTDA